MTLIVTPQAAIDRFLRRIKPPACLMVAISGGSDSTGLLVLLHSALESDRFPGIRLCAATVDHGLRPESADEALAVARLCRDYGIAHRIALWDGEKPRTGLAAAAREKRYELLCRMAADFQADAILTAHTADDQIETAMMRAERSTMSDARGLASMAPAVLLQRRHWLLRPLLACRRDDIRALLRDRGIRWFDDPSNTNPEYERPRLRRRLTDGETPLDLTEIKAAQRRRFALSTAAAAFVRRAVTVHGGAAIAVERSAIGTLQDDAVLSYALSCLAAVAGGRTHPLSQARMQRVAQFCRSGECGRLTAGRVVFDLRRDRLYLTREWRDISSLRIVGGQSAVWDNRYRIENRQAQDLTVGPAGCFGEERAAALFAALPPGVARRAAATLPLCESAGRRLPAPDFIACPDATLVSGFFENAPAGADLPAVARVCHFLAPFDRFLPLFDVTLAGEIAGRFMLDRYGLPFRVDLTEIEG